MKRETCRKIFSNTCEVFTTATLLDSYWRPGNSYAALCKQTISEPRSAGERREKERGARKRGRKKGGKRRERKTRGRESGEGTCTRARRTRLSGQFESIKPKVAAGLCSSTRSLLPETPFLFSSLDSSLAILGGSRGNKPAIFTLHRQPRHSWLLAPAIIPLSLSPPSRYKRSRANPAQWLLDRATTVCLAHHFAQQNCRGFAQFPLRAAARNGYLAKNAFPIALVFVFSLSSRVISALLISRDNEEQY